MLFWRVVVTVISLVHTQEYPLHDRYATEALCQAMVHEVLVPSMATKEGVTAFVECVQEWHA